MPIIVISYLFLLAIQTHLERKVDFSCISHLLNKLAATSESGIKFALDYCKIPVSAWMGLVKK